MILLFTTCLAAGLLAGSPAPQRVEVLAPSAGVPHPLEPATPVTRGGGCSRADGASAQSELPHANHITRIDRALTAAAGYLIARQSTDGTWPSEVTGVLHDGTILTPHVLSALFYMQHVSPDVRPAFDRGVANLVHFVEGGSIPGGEHGVRFPVYTAAGASRIVVLGGRTPERVRAQRVWLDFVLDRRLGESLGWQRSDPEFGGWSYAPGIPRRPVVEEYRNAMLASNISATLYGIAALRSAGICPPDPVFDDILLFIERCQNFPAAPALADERFDDGGFHFMPGDPVLNKTGPVGQDRFGRTRFGSYGSATADGLRALVRCGLPPDHPRVVAARAWLERHFTASRNPGAFAPDREVIREGTYYYYTWSVAHAFMATSVREVQTQTASVDWAAALADELVRRQHDDGSWTNPSSSAKEDDPLVATPFAAAALAICRETFAR